MNRLLVTIFLAVFLSNIFAQNDNYSTLNMFNHMYYNPGYAGDGNEIEAKILNRNQWLSFPGTPNTFTASIDAPFKLFRQRHGVGLNFTNDELGFFSNKVINISYAYRKTLMQGELGIGAGLIMISNVLDADWVATDEPTSDEAIPNNPSNDPFGINMNLGVFYTTDNLYLSISGKNLIGGAKLKYISESDDARPVYNYGTQFFVSTGYNYQLTNPMFSIQPNLFIASDFASTQWSLSGILTYNQRFFGGLAYKQTDAVSVIGGIDLPSGLTVSVSYDVTTSRIINNSFGSFEFMVGYSFSLDIDKDNRKYKSVRFL